MVEIEIETRIRAPIERCFDLARDVEVHAQSAAFTAERVIPPGRTEGLLELGDLVTFCGHHLGVTRTLTARVVELHRPDPFVDEMVAGAFQSLRHVHEFEQVGDETIMKDTLRWKAPCGALGRLANELILRRHLRWFLRKKQRALKVIAEAAALLAGVWLLGCGEQPYRTYPDASAAIAAGELARGWFPEWFPRSATDIHLQGDLDTGERWLRARLPAAAARSLRAQLVPVEASEVNVRRPRWSGRWWFEGLVQQQPANDGALNADLFRGTGEPVPRTEVVAFDRLSQTVYVWTNEAR